MAAVSKVVNDLNDQNSRNITNNSQLTGLVSLSDQISDELTYTYNAIKCVSRFVFEIVRHFCMYIIQWLLNVVSVIIS